MKMIRKVYSKLCFDCEESRKIIGKFKIKMCKSKNSIISWTSSTKKSLKEIQIQWFDYGKKMEGNKIHFTYIVNKIRPGLIEEEKLRNRNETSWKHIYGLWLKEIQKFIRVMRIQDKFIKKLNLEPCKLYCMVKLKRLKETNLHMDIW